MKYKNIKPSLFLLLILLLFISCQQNSPENPSTDEFILADDFKIDLVAAEPLLDSPVAIAFDHMARIWAVEMPGYMRDIDGSEEEKPDGKIVILSDTNADGIMDKRTVFLDNLVTPRALALVYDGILYTDGTKLWWTTIEKKNRKKELVDSLYILGGNIEHQANGLLYHLDNWIYSAKSNARYRRKNEQWIKEATSTRGQWGISSDDVGRLFYNNNSTTLIADLLMPNLFIKNSFQKIKHGRNQVVIPDRRVFPFQPTAVNRGYVKDVLDKNKKLVNITSSCGPLIYNGNQFPSAFDGNAFICVPEANLIKRYLLQEKQGRITGNFAYEKKEFLVSKDESFRPVNLYTGLDGAMYIVDLRQGVIQHRAYMTSYLREQLLQKGLDKINGKGRIYKIQSISNKQNTIPNFENYTLNDFVKLLQSPNAQLRNFAQQQIVFAEDMTIVNELEKTALDHQFPKAQIHALWTLEGLGQLTKEILIKLGKQSDEPTVLAHVVRLSEFFKKDAAHFLTVYQKAIFTNNAYTDLQLCHSLGHLENEKMETIYLQLANKYQNDSLYCEALISGIAGKEELLLEKMNSKFANSALIHLLKETIQNKKQNLKQAPHISTQTINDDRTHGFKLYNTYCASCHALDGKGDERLAPPLLHSEYLTGSADKLILLILNGLEGPIHVNGKLYDLNLVMPGIKNNNDLTDAAIMDLLIFIGNSFSLKRGESLTVERIRELREQSKNRKTLYTEEELKDW